MKSSLTLILLLSALLTNASETFEIRYEYFIGEQVVFSPNKSHVIARKQVAHKTIYDRNNALVQDIAHFPNESRIFSISYIIPTGVAAIETTVNSPIPGLTGIVRFYGQRWAWYGFTLEVSIPGTGSMNIFGHYYPNGGFYAVKETYSLKGKLMTISETEYLRVSKTSFDKVTQKI